MNAFIFDLDGVIINSEPEHEAVFYELFAELGHGEDHGIDFDAFYGTSDLTVWKAFLQRHPQTVDLNALQTRKEDRFIERARQTRPFFEGALSLIQHLPSSLRLAVASGSNRRIIREVLALADLTHQFEAIASAEEVEHGKPRPDVFLLAAQRLGVDPSECYVLEDSVNGVTAANAAGMRSIAIANTFAVDQLGHAWKQVTDYSEIAPLLDLP